MTSTATPRFSVFTPSHQPRFLDECLKALQAQTCQDWEWIVLLNGGARWRPERQDERVRVEIADSIRGVGAAKRRACELARGEILVELDHDDLLAKGCLTELAKAFDAHPEAVLVYSNTAQITEDGKRDDTRFNEAHGWKYEDVRVDGRKLLQAVSMEPTPHNVSYIWYAPNHVRAFRKESYEKAAWVRRHAHGARRPGPDVPSVPHRRLPPHPPLSVPAADAPREHPARSAGQRAHPARDGRPVRQVHRGQRPRLDAPARTARAGPRRGPPEATRLPGRGPVPR